MKRLLVLADIYPFPPTTGGMLRDANIIIQLSKRFIVDLVSFSSVDITNKEIDLAKKYCDNVLCVIQKEKKLAKRILNIIGSRCDGEVKIYNSEITKIIELLMKENDYEFIWCERPYTFQFAEKYLGKLKVLVDMHDVEREAIHYFVKIESNWMKKIRYLIEEKKIKRLENKILSTADIISFVSKRDKERYDVYCPFSQKCIVINNGVDLNNAKKLSKGVKNKNVVLFVGSLRHLPNLHGIKWFAMNVWPEIVSENREAVLNIVGSGEIDQNTLNLFNSTKGINYIGFVEEVFDYLSEASCMVVPLFSGSGTRLKILEAFSFGIPVVSTVIGAEGIECKDGCELLIANEKETMKTSVLRLLDDAGLSKNIANNAYECVRKLYDWNVIGEKLIREL